MTSIGPDRSGASDPPPQERTLRDRAIALLARREHSVRELRLKLLQRDFVSADIEPVLHDLEAENLLSDERFAQEYVHARYNRGFGPVRIRAELQRRGVDESLIRRSLDGRDDGWAVRAGEMLRKRFAVQQTADTTERRRWYRYLVNRGFTSTQIERAMGEGG